MLFRSKKNCFQNKFRTKTHSFDKFSATKQFMVCYLFIKSNRFESVALHCFKQNIVYLSFHWDNVRMLTSNHSIFHFQAVSPPHRNSFLCYQYIGNCCWELSARVLYLDSFCFFAVQLICLIVWNDLMRWQ